MNLKMVAFFLPLCVLTSFATLAGADQSSDVERAMASARDLEVGGSTLAQTMAAHQFLDLKALGQAIWLYRQAALSETTDSTAAMRVAYFHYKSRNYERAASWLEKLVDDGIGLAPGMQWVRAHCWLQTGDLGSAVALHSSLLGENSVLGQHSVMALEKAGSCPEVRLASLYCDVALAALERGDAGYAKQVLAASEDFLDEADSVCRRGPESEETGLKIREVENLLEN